MPPTEFKIKILRVDRLHNSVTYTYQAKDCEVGGTAPLDGEISIRIKELIEI